MKKTRNLRRKGGADGGYAASLLALVTLFIVLYILLVPPAEREKLLNYDINSSGDLVENSSGANYVLIMKKSPGFLGHVSTLVCDDFECEHKIPTFSLFKTTSSEVLSEFNPFIIRNNVFKKEFKTLQFEMNSLPTTDNVILSMSAKTHKGILKIILNGYVIFESSVDSYNVPTISIPQKYLEDKNTLEFSVSNVGVAFWDTNEYSIEGLKIVGDVTDISRQENSNPFFISEEEFELVDSVKMKFFPDCETGKVGRLQIRMNGKTIHDAVPDCGLLNTIELDPSVVLEGENTVSFSTSYGSYLVDQVKVWTHMKDLEYPVYYFDLYDDEYEDITSGDADLNITVEFAKKPSEDFNFFLFVNGHTKSLRAEEDQRYVERHIPASDLKKDNNWIKIEPDSESLNIAELRLEIKPVEDDD